MIAIIFIFLFILLSIIFLLFKSSKLTDRFTLIIAYIALIVSITSSFKEYIFPYKLKILSGDLILAAVTKPSGNPDILTLNTTQVPIILPLTFVNDGYKDIIIEAILLKIIDENNNINIYRPFFEIDFLKYMNGKRRVHPENIQGTFLKFCVSINEATVKSILFLLDPSEIYPEKKWIAGKHKFIIYVKTNHDKKPKKLSKFDWVINDENINGVTKGNSGYFLSSRISHSDI